MIGSRRTAAPHLAVRTGLCHSVAALCVAALAVGAPATAADLTGTPGADSLTGTEAADTLAALAGDDLVDGLGGPDVLHGGPGTDRVLGGTGRDELWGDTGDDVLQGGGGSDTVHGNDADRVWGGGLDDRIFIRGNSVVHGGSGADYLESTWADVTPRLYGDRGGDVLWAATASGGIRFGHARLFGGPGDDQLYSGDDGEVHAGTGDDQMLVTESRRVYAEDGDDLLSSYTDPAVTNRLSCGPGYDIVVDADSLDVIDADCEEVTVHVPGGTGGPGRQLVRGTPHDDRINLAGGGHDVEALEGDDEVTLGQGGDGDTVDAGAGDDTVFATNGGVDRADQITCGTGTDQVVASSSDDIAADCESALVLTFGTDAAEQFTGTVYDDYVSAGAGDDTVDALGGEDQVWPEDGADAVDAGDGDDVVTLAEDAVVDVVHCGAGADTVYAADPDDIVADDCETVEVGLRSAPQPARGPRSLLARR